MILWRQWDAAYSIHGSPPNRLRSCESGGGRDTLETVGPAAYSTETASTMGRGHRVCECNMLHVHAVRLVSHTRCRGRARGAPAVVVAWAVRWRRGSRDDPDSESFRTVCVRSEHIPNKGQKARRLRHAATRDFLAELAASRGAGRSCLRLRHVSPLYASSSIASSLPQACSSSSSGNAAAKVSSIRPSRSSGSYRSRCSRTQSSARVLATRPWWWRT